MKLTTKHLKQIIKEELSKILEMDAEQATLAAATMGQKKFQNQGEVAKAWAEYVRDYADQREDRLQQAREANPFAALQTVDQMLAHIAHLAENPVMYGKGSDDEQYRSIAYGIDDLKDRGETVNPSWIAKHAKAMYRGEWRDIPDSDDTEPGGEFKIHGQG